MKTTRGKNVRIKNPLKAYLALIGLSLGDFGEIIGYSPYYITACINGREKATKRLVWNILKITNGEVDLNYLLEQKPLKKKENKTKKQDEEQEAA